MTTPIPKTRRAARRVATRALVAALVRWAGIGLSVGLVCALAIVGLDRLIGPLAPLWALVAIPGGAGLLAGLAMGASRAWNFARAGVEIDHALGLRDALSSAIAFASHRSGADPAFVELATRDAERVASGVRARRVVRITAGASWIVWPVAGALCVLAGLYVPRLERAVNPADDPRLELKRDQVARQVAEASRAARDAVESTPGDAASQEQLSALEELERELLGDDRDPGEIASQAADKLDRLADQIERESDVAQRTADEMRRQLAGADTETEGPAGDLARAIKDGDLAAARDAARRLLDEAPKLDELQRQELAQDLADLAEQLESARPPEASDDRLASDLRDQGLTDQQIDEITREPDAEIAARQLEQQGVNPDIARRLAERSADEAKQREAQDRAQEQRRSLEDALRRTADDLDPARPKPQPPEDRQDQADPSQPQDRRQNEQGADENDKPAGDDQSERPGQPGDREQPDRQPGQEQATKDDKTGGQGDDQSGDTKTDEPSKDQQTQPVRQQPGQQQPAQEQPAKDQPGAQPGDQGEQQTQPDKQGEGEQQATPGDEASDAPQGAESQPGEGAEPTAQPGTTSDPAGDTQGTPQPGDQGEPVATPMQGEDPTLGADDAVPDDRGMRPGAGPQAGDQNRPGNLYEQLERLAGAEDRARRQSQDAEELRRRAQELLDNATPEQLEQMRELADQLAQDQAPPPTLPPRSLTDSTNELFDARPTGDDAPPAPEQTIAQWYADEPLDTSDRVGHSPVAERMREAAAGAERAIEQQRVPRRHRDLLRRVFRRYAGETNAPPAVEDARDAGAP
jgi:hypothetical protein